MPLIKDPYQPLLPLTAPTVNYYDWFLGRPELSTWPNYTLHIDPITGERRRFRFVLERFEHAATALVSSPGDGGLGLTAGQSGIVGILSENCLVCSNSCSSRHLCPHRHDQGIPGSRICPA